MHSSRKKSTKPEKISQTKKLFWQLFVHKFTRKKDLEVIKKNLRKRARNKNSILENKNN